MKLIVHNGHIHITAGEGTGGECIGKLREGVDAANAQAECVRVNRDVLQPLRGTHNARASRRAAAREALADLIA